MRPSLAVGVSGSIAAGKTTLAGALERRGFSYARFSLALDDLLAERGLPRDRFHRQKLGNEINASGRRRRLGARTVARAADADRIVIDGLPFPDDHAFMVERFGAGFRHVFIDAGTDVRRSRYEGGDSGTASGLSGAIGSTGSGVGAAVMASVARGAGNFELECFEAADHRRLESFIYDTSEHLRSRLDAGYRVIVEGTQGFGLFLLEGGYWPKATSRSTTAAGGLAEAGISPVDVDDVTMVIRSFPIRVAGDSGPLVGETTWEE